jgi:hypothetical protein
MTRPITTLYTILAALLALCAHGAATLTLTDPAEAASVPARAASCAEDDPCWNWAKDGNHKRGVTLVDGTPKVVTVCGFNRLWAHGAIRYSLKYNGALHSTGLPKLRGDYYARTLTDCAWRIRQAHPYPWHQGPGRWAVQHGY